MSRIICTVAECRGSPSKTRAHLHFFLNFIFDENSFRVSSGRKFPSPPSVGARSTLTVRSSIVIKPNKYRMHISINLWDRVPPAERFTDPRTRVKQAVRIRVRVLVCYTRPDVQTPSFRPRSRETSVRQRRSRCFQFRFISRRVYNTYAKTKNTRNAKTGLSSERSNRINRARTCVCYERSGVYISLYELTVGNVVCFLGT